MPSYGAEVIGPPSRPSDQPLWDPEVQAMDPEQRRELQLRRLREMIAKTLDGDAALFRRKLDEAGITSANDITSLDDINQIPVTRKQELRDSEAEHPPLGDYRYTPLSACVRVGQSTGTTGHADADDPDPPRPVARVRVGRPQLVAQRLASRSGGHALPPGLHVRRRSDARRLDRVLRRPEHVGRAARHRRDRRAGHPHVAAHPPRRADGGAQPAPVPGGRGQDGPRPRRGLRLPRLLDGWVRPRPAAADDGRVRVLRLPRRTRPHLRRRPPARGLGRHPGARSRRPAPTCPPGNGATSS